MATDDDSPERLSEIYRRIDELSTLASKDPAQVQKMLPQALQEIKACLEKLSFADEMRKQIDEPLGVSEEHLRALMDHNPSLIFLKDESGRYVYLNSAYERNFIQSKDWYGKTDFNIWPKESAELFRENDSDVLKSGRMQQLLEDSTDLDGTRHCWLCYKFPFTDLSGAKYVGGIGIDATDRVRAEEALRKSEEEYRYLVKYAPAGIYEIDYTGPRLKRVNDAMCRILGYTEEELLALDPASLLDDESKVRFQERVRKVLAGEPIDESVAFRIICKDGRWIWGDLNIKPIFTDGKMSGALVIAHDITDRKKAEEALNRSEAQLRSIIENSADSAYRRDLRIDRFDYVSPTIENLTGFCVDEMMAMSAADVVKRVCPEDLDAVSEKFEATLRGEPATVEYRFRHKDGSYRWFADSINTLADADGKPVYRIGVIRDITDRKRAEDALRKAHDELELRVQERTAELVKAKDLALEAVEAKAAFMANMSHELRTPMNAIIGFSNLLLEDPLTPDQKDSLERIKAGGESLLALINDVLDFSKAEKKKIVLECRPFSLRSLIEESLDMVAPAAAEKGLGLAYTIDYGTPDTIIGDHGRLRQILVNLLGNAVKFTDIGKVSVSISTNPIKANEHKIKFEVQDTGIGIEPENLGKLFLPFSQLENNLSQKRDGTGLGLAISKQLVDLMGGMIWAESTPGLGSKFKFTIDAEFAQAKLVDWRRAVQITSENPAEKKPLRILVAEDNPSNQKVLVEMLRKLGYRADVAADGLEVLEALEGLPYDLVFMDVKMPEMDGIEAAKEIRKRRPENGPKIIAITAYALDGDKEKCLEAGMDDYISKPVRKGDLAALLRSITSSQE